MPLLTTAAFDGDHGVVERDPSTDRKRFAHFAVQSRVLFSVLSLARIKKTTF